MTYYTRNIVVTASENTISSNRSPARVTCGNPKNEYSSRRCGLTHPLVVAENRCENATIVSQHYEYIRQRIDVFEKETFDNSMKSNDVRGTNRTETLSSFTRAFDGKQ